MKRAFLLLSLLFQEKINGTVNIFSVCSQNLFPEPKRNNEEITLGSRENPSTIECSFEYDDEKIDSNRISISNENDVFSYCTPYFNLKKLGDEEIEKIWWQISSDEDFSLIPSNFEEVNDFTNTVNLPTITDTFFNSEEKYYFRVKAWVNGSWKDWSETFIFSVFKARSCNFYRI